MDYNIYISYRKSDGGALAQSIFMSLQQKGYKCFFDFAIMRMGDTFEDQIRNVIKTSKNFIFIMTPLAVSGCLREHDWVAHELKIAIDSGCNIIPVVSADNPIE